MLSPQKISDFRSPGGDFYKRSAFIKLVTPFLGFYKLIIDNMDVFTPSTLRGIGKRVNSIDVV